LAPLLLLGATTVCAEPQNALAAFARVTVMFAVIYKAMPRVRVQWRDVWSGAIFTAMLGSLGRYLIGLWVYCPAQIFLWEAEFTRWHPDRPMSARHGLRPDTPIADELACSVKYRLTTNVKSLGRTVRLGAFE
jgi:membrane protein